MKFISLKETVEMLTGGGLGSTEEKLVSSLARAHLHPLLPVNGELWHRLLTTNNQCIVHCICCKSCPVFPLHLLQYRKSSESAQMVMLFIYYDNVHESMQSEKALKENLQQIHFTLRCVFILLICMLRFCSPAEPPHFSCLTATGWWRQAITWLCFIISDSHSNTIISVN